MQDLVQIPVWGFVPIATIPAGVTLVLGFVIPWQSHQRQVELQRAEHLSTQNLARLAEVRDFRREPLKETRTLNAAIVAAMRTVVDDVAIIQDLRTTQQHVPDERIADLNDHVSHWRQAVLHHRLALLSTGDAELTRLAREDFDPSVNRFIEGLGDLSDVQGALPSDELRERVWECMEVSQRIIRRVEGLAGGGE